MSKKKRGTFGKKASRKHSTAVLGPSATAANPSLAVSSRSNPPGRQPWMEEANPNYMPGNTNTSRNAMQELARNTRNEAAHWDQNTRLRDRSVTFISGGFIEPSKSLKSEMAPLDTITKPNESKGKHNEVATGSTIEPTELNSRLHIEATNVSPNPIFDVPAEDTDFSDEIILFKGRGGRQSKHPGSSSRTPVQESLQLRPLPNSAQDGMANDADDADDNDSDAAINDYISNMLLDDMQNTIQQSHINNRELGGFDNSIVFKEHAQSSTDLSASKFERFVLPDTNEKAAERSDDEDDEDDKEDEAWELAETIDDEKLARLFAKQEELGMGSGELLLDADSVKDTPKRKTGRLSTHTKTRQSAISFRGFRPIGGSYPSAEAVANAFEQLDMTSWEDDQDFEFHLSDSELEAQLKDSWQKDRQRKKEKKLAREELRERGLLRKNANSDDPRVKYPNGIHLDDIKTEFHDFLLSSRISISFPPMNAQSRKVIHELAHQFNITSKSTGSGDQRRPTLSRTKATAPYDETKFQGIFMRIRRRYLPRSDSNKNSGKAQHGNAGLAVVRHGEIVGGSAPEIGQTNKGRSMLEKMGWSMGMALGANDNKGTTQLIEHVVIRSKAGLG